MDAQKDTLAERLGKGFHSKGKRAVDYRRGLELYRAPEPGAMSNLRSNLILTAFLLVSAIASASILRFGLGKVHYFQQDGISESGSGSRNVAASDMLPAEGRITNERTAAGQEQPGIVLGEEDVRSLAVSSSENFEAAQVNVGGNLLLIQDNENLPLTISDIKSESFVSGDKDESKIVISWRTGKPAVSELDYGKNGQKDPIAIKEESYGSQHSVILAGLEPRTAYTYIIKCKDHFGNTKDSEYYGIYTASKPVSVFDMISKSLNEIFGWAVNKS